MRYNPLSVNSPNGDTVMYVDADGNTVVNSLILTDSVDGSKWKLIMIDGVISTEPLDIINKRNQTISRLLE